MKQTIMVLLALVSTVFATDVLPSSPKGQLVRQYLDAFNSGEPAMRAFLERTPSGTAMEERIARYRGMKSDIGSFTPIRLIEESADSLQVIVLTADHRELRLSITFAGDPPHIAGLRIEQLTPTLRPTPGALRSKRAPCSARFKPSWKKKPRQGNSREPFSLLVALK